MAKSLRSKWRRKMRSVKRERYGKKELERLKTILKNAQDNTDLMEIVPSTSLTAVEKEQKINPNPDETMDTDEMKRKYSKDLKDQFGNYPPWMGQRQIKKHKLKKGKKKKVKKN